MGGMVLETNMTEILLRIEEQNKIAKEEVIIAFLFIAKLFNVTQSPPLLSDIVNLILIPLQAGLSAAPTRAISAVKNMNIPQQIKDIKLPELPQAIKDLKL